MKQGYLFPFLFFPDSTSSFVLCGQFALHIAELKRRRTRTIPVVVVLWRATTFRKTQLLKKKIWFHHSGHLYYTRHTVCTSFSWYAYFIVYWFSKYVLRKFSICPDHKTWCVNPKNKKMKVNCINDQKIAL